MNKRTIQLIICILIGSRFLPAQIGQGLPEDNVQPITIKTEKVKSGSPLLVNIQGGLMLSVGTNTNDDWENPMSLGFSVRTGSLWELGFMTLNLGIESGYYSGAAKEVSADLSGIPANLIVGLDMIHTDQLYLSLDQYIGIDSEQFIYNSLFPAYGAGISMTWFPLNTVGINLNGRGRLILSDDTSSYQGSQAWLTVQAGLTIRFPYLLP